MAYMDGMYIGRHSYDHSDFNWKREINIGWSADESKKFIGQMKEITISKILPAKKVTLPSLNQKLVFNGASWKNRKHFGNVKYAGGIWTLNNAFVRFQNAKKVIPDRNFRISLKFRSK